jgi:hypothetical protein
MWVLLMTPLGAIALGAILGIIREAGRLDISTIVHHPIPRHFDHPDFPSLID